MYTTLLFNFIKSAFRKSKRNTILALTSSILLISNAFAGSKNYSLGGTDTVTTSMIVYGNSSCKERIDNLTSGEQGVISASWNSQNMLLELKYLSKIVNIKRLAQKLADAGFDNEFYLAADDAYAKLSGNSIYPRPGETKINSDKNSKEVLRTKHIVETDDSQQKSENEKVGKIKKVEAQTGDN